jgi:hypothetical protein
MFMCSEMGRRWNQVVRNHFKVLSWNLFCTVLTEVCACSKQINTVGVVQCNNITTATEIIRI